MNRHIWVAEDNNSLCQSVARKLETLGYTTKTFSNPGDVIDAIGQVKKKLEQTPDLIITDDDFSRGLSAGKNFWISHEEEAFTSGMDIIETVRRINQWDTPVILLSGNLEITNRSFPGVFPLQKVDIADLENTINTALSSVSSGRRL